MKYGYELIYANEDEDYALLEEQYSFAQNAIPGKRVDDQLSFRDIWMAASAKPEDFPEDLAKGIHNYVRYDDDTAILPFLVQAISTEIELARSNDYDPNELETERILAYIKNGENITSLSVYQREVAYLATKRAAFALAVLG